MHHKPNGLLWMSKRERERLLGRRKRLKEARDNRAREITALRHAVDDNEFLNLTMRLCEMQKFISMSVCAINEGDEQEADALMGEARAISEVLSEDILELQFDQERPSWLLPNASRTKVQLPYQGEVAWQINEWMDRFRFPESGDERPWAKWWQEIERTGALVLPDARQQKRGSLDLSLLPQDAFLELVSRFDFVDDESFYEGLEGRERSAARRQVGAFTKKLKDAYDAMYGLPPYISRS